MFALDKETRWILGRPNFACAGLAERLRRLGHTIRPRAEDEQAAVIHWMLTLYEEHGPAWRDHAARFLQRPEANQ